MTERVSVKGLRTLGAPKADLGDGPERTPAETEIAKKAWDTLKGEFEAALTLKAKLAGEAIASADDKGRDPKVAEKLRSIVASLEGMSRFAISMGLLTPAENRTLWAEAIKNGLYEGWR